MRILTPCIVFAVLAAAAAAHAEPVLESRIGKVSLFKNGLVLVERDLKPTSAGTFELDAAPKPIHGTFWMEGDRSLVARVAMRKRAIPAGRPGDLQTEYAGIQVTVYLANVQQPLQGVVREFTRPKTAAAAATPYASVSAPPQSSRFLVLDTDNGETLIDVNRIAYLQAKGKAKPPTTEQPVLLIQVGPEAKNKPIKLRYLARGMSWAPSYQVDLLSKTRLRLTQTALLRNELRPIENADVELISGFPNIRFRHVMSPLAPGATWSDFFRQAASNPSQSQYGGVLGNNYITQQIISNSAMPGPSPDALPPLPAGEGVDMHYERVGKHTLGLNEAIQLDVESEETDYRRIVEWTIPDSHDARGRRVGNSGDIGEAWDALHFKNPLSMPMTTGPAAITEGGRFNGQTISTWVSQGELTSLKVTKALSIRTHASEHEQSVPESRDSVYIAGERYARVTIEAVVRATNHRAERVELQARRKFSGDLISAEGDPVKRLLEEGAYSVNRRNEMVWTMQLEPGKSVEYQYKYRLLVRR